MIFSTIIEYALILSIYTLKLDEKNYNINSTKPNFRDKICMILNNPRRLDLISIVTFSSCFAIYNFNYWVILDHAYKK